MPKPETIAWLRQSAAMDGSVTSQTLLEVLERLDGLASLMLRFHPELYDEIREPMEPTAEPLDEAENDRRSHACMKAIDDAVQVAPPRLRCPGAHTIAECGGPCEHGFEHCDCGLKEELNPASDLPGKAPNQPKSAPAPAGLSLIDEIADAFCGRYYDRGGVARWRPEARRAVAVIVRRLRERSINGSAGITANSVGIAANWLAQEAAK